MCHRHLSRDASGKLLDTFDDSSLRGKLSDVGFLGVRTAYDVVRDFVLRLAGMVPKVG